jgi:uncharacterized membrane protein YfcA
VLLVGIGGGLAASVAALASLVSYPALLALGLPPVMANISNTVAQIAGGAGAVYGSTTELVHQKSRIPVVAAAALVGGAAGALLLLATPSDAFEKAVPWLIGCASIAVLLPKPAVHRPPRHPKRVLAVGTGLIAIYGGYFGAASGVVVLALFLRILDQSLARTIALKNVEVAMANAVAGLFFICTVHLEWHVIIPLAIGFLIGGRVGPLVVRRIPARPLKTAIAVLGVGLAIKLGISAY